MASSARIDELRKKFDENPRRYFAPLANEFRKAGDPEQAVFICQEYLPQQPGHMSGHIVYGQALFELGRDEEAKAVFETALSLDPENLIALRHLGDIARQAGDLDVARFWYQRVLESDPRNEEIAQVLMNLDAVRGGATNAAVEEPPPVPVAEPSAPPSSEHAPVDVEAAPQTPEQTAAAAEPSEAESYEPFEGFDRTIDFEQPSSEPVVEPEPPAIVEASASHPVSWPANEEEAPVAPVAPVAASEPDAGELLDIDDFSIGGTPLSVPAVAEQPEPKATTGEASELPPIEFTQGEEAVEFAATAEQPTAPAVESSSISEAGFDDDALFGDHAATFEPEFEERADASVALTPETEPEPVIELATDIALGLPPDEPESPAAQPASEPPAEIFEPAAAAPIEASGEAEIAAEQTPGSTEEVFVTETMANLYVQQGHLANALEIYEKLLAHRPDDTQLQERIREIKERIYGRPPATVWEPEPVAAAGVAAAPGPTIREYLRGVIAGRSAQAASNGAAPRSEPETMPPAGSPAETVTGSIDALFANSEPTEEDRSAANALAQAFGDWPEPTPIRGVPAHEASSELSLDHVFKANAPAPRREDADAFSFDQFFSEDLGQSSSEAQDQPGRGSAEPGDDIAQFNAWLNGLKKT